MSNATTKYVIISPVRDEEKFLEGTLESVIHQRILPAEYILVNDGSTDRTPEIIDKYTQKYPWIKRVDIKDRGYYLPGAGVVNAFYAGLQKVTVQDWDYLVKLDCDLSFESDYFERLLAEFDQNPKLGLASGCTYIQRAESLIQEKAQEDHPWGASKVYKRACYDQMGGIKAIPGWDLADVLSAQMHGWQTRCFFDLVLIHHRPTGGRRSGLTGGFFLHGRNLYRFGYSFLYTFLKGIYRLTDRPVFLAGAGIIAGYLFAFLKREEFIFEKDMRRFLRKKHRRDLLKRLRLIS